MLSMESKEKVKKDVTPDLAKQLASVAFTVRKMKNWMEEKMGADLDGDGRIGSGPYNKVKKLGVLLAIAGLATVCSAAPYNTNNTVFVGPIASLVSYVDESGNIIAPYFIGNGSLLTAVPGTGSTIAPGYLWVGNPASNAVAVAMSGDVTIITNGTTTIGAHAVEVTMLPEMITGQILVGDTTDSNANVVALSGVTVDAAGVASVAASAIPVAAAKFIVGNAAGAGAAVTLSSGVTVTTTGVATVASVALAVLTNAAGFAAESLYTGTYTNGPGGCTNVIVVINGLIQSATLNP